MQPLRRWKHARSQRLRRDQGLSRMIATSIGWIHDITWMVIHFEIDRI